MGISVLWDWFLKGRRKKEREELLAKAQSWPTVTAKLLPGKVVDKDDLAEGTTVQDRQAEFPFYFSIEDGFFGGHLRTVAMSDGEAFRFLKQVAEGTPVTVRYNPANPDEVCVLRKDNVDVIPLEIWEG